jgi:hypothetical protein
VTEKEKKNIGAKAQGEKRPRNILTQINEPHHVKERHRKWLWVDFQQFHEIFKF